MRKLVIINRSLMTIMNLLGFLVFLSTFILVFFFPEIAGEIFAKLVNGFKESLK